MRFAPIAVLFLAMTGPVHAADTPPGGFDPVPPSAFDAPADQADLPQIPGVAMPRAVEPDKTQPVQAPAEPTAPPGSTANLAANCSIGLIAYQSGTPDIHIGQCSGFVDAVMQDLQERIAAGEKTGICLTGNVNELDTIKQFVLWAGRHPESEQALDGVRNSLKEAYPCKPDAKPVDKSPAKPTAK